MGNDDKVGEERKKFNMRVFGSAPWMKAVEKQRHRTKVFKSGNSLAVRIPSGTKLVAGMEMDLLVEDGQFLLRTSRAAKADVQHRKGGRIRNEPEADTA